jgi:hypothetical protein
VNQNFKLTLLKSDFFDDTDYSNLINKLELDFLDIIDKLSIEQEYDFTKEIAIFQSNLDIIKIILDKNTDKKYIKILSFNDNY